MTAIWRIGTKFASTPRSCGPRTYGGRSRTRDSSVPNQLQRSQFRISLIKFSSLTFEDCSILTRGERSDYFYLWVRLESVKKSHGYYRVENYFLTAIDLFRRGDLQVRSPCNSIRSRHEDGDWDLGRIISYWNINELKKIGFFILRSLGNASVTKPM